MALLSTFLLKDASAAAALAVDRDPAILAAAAIVAEAFGVQPQFRRIDFDRDGDWEDQLAAFRPTSWSRSASCTGCRTRRAFWLSSGASTR